MSDRDRLARVVALELVRQAREASDYQNRDCYKVADALIAAGVTMPALCGDRAVGMREVLQIGGTDE